VFQGTRCVAVATSATVAASASDPPGRRRQSVARNGAGDALILLVIPAKRFSTAEGLVKPGSSAFKSLKARALDDQT